jgi:crotonobetainyl-CoA:carnitine CoA-transferase CaiB-like acyl-CoA transferase
MVFGGLLEGYAPPIRERPDRPYNRHSMNNAISRNKLSCSLDPRRPEARELLLRLVDRSDVFIENLKASALHNMGIEEDELLSRNPRLILVRMPPAGLSGEWSTYKGLGSQFDGLSGLSWLLGHHDQELVDAAPAIYMDAASGPAAAFAVLAALHHRDHTGRGQQIEMAQLENIIAHIGDVLVDLQLGISPERFGNRDRFWAPQGVYSCRGDFHWLAISVTNDLEWSALAHVVGGPGLAGDERFRAGEDRLRYHADIDEILSAWAARHDLLEAFHLLQAANVAASPILVDDLLESDPNTAHRRWVQALDSTDVGTYPHIGHAFRGLPQAWDRGSPMLGEDNRYVYQELLGLDDNAYRHLVDQRIAVQDYLDEDLRPL